MEYRSHAFPWHHYTFENFFESKDFEILKSLDNNNADYSKITGFRDVIKDRMFLNNNLVEKDDRFLISKVA